MATRTVAPQDRVQVESSFARGIVRDVAPHLIPPGGVYDAQDFLLEQPGKAYKRGGWERHSARIGTSIACVATLHIPTRVVAVGDDGNVYNVTSEGSPQADSIGACFGPRENPPQYVDRLIFCDPDGTSGPKKVYWTGSAMAVANLGGTPPAAVHSTVHAGRIVLARSDTASGNLNRIWFSPIAGENSKTGVEDTWDPTNMYIDATAEVTGLAVVQGVMLVFAPTSMERILGGIPPGITGVTSDMELQPCAGVGCLDARSIVHLDSEVIFASEQGVFATNGAGARSLTDKRDGTGIQAYWRTLFPPSEIRQVVGGLLAREFYIVSILDDVNAIVDTLLCHIPTATWTRLGNFGARSMAVGRTEQETLELYIGSSIEGYVWRASGMLRPDSTNSEDGNGVPVVPEMTLRAFGGPGGLRAFGYGHLSYDMRAA